MTNTMKRSALSRKPLYFSEFFGFKEWTFALFLLAGVFKPNPKLNDSMIDLTVVTALVSALCVGWNFFRAKEGSTKSTLAVLGLFLLFVPSLLWTDWTTYAVEKVSRFYTLTLFAAIAPIYLIKTRDELRRFLSGFVVLCTIVAAAALVVLMTQGQDLERLSALGATTIMTGRFAAVVMLFNLLLYFDNRLNPYILAASCLVLPTLIIAAGSRGPLVAAPVALASTLLLFRTKIHTHFSSLALILLLSAGIIWLSLPLIPSGAVWRVGTFIGAQFGTSENDRVTLIEDSLPEIAKTPQGLGLGGFATKLGVGGGEIGEYPHNIVLEVLLEGGWLTGGYFIFLLVYAFRGIYSVSRQQPAPFLFKLAFCFLVFFFLNDLVSGELNESKVSFAFMGLAIGLKGHYGERIETRRVVQAIAHSLK